MKLDTVKALIAFVLALLLGFVCEIIAPEAESRNWISLSVSSVGILSVLLPAMGIKFSNPIRGASIRLFAWMMTVFMVITNIAFACFEYRIDVYLVVILLLAVIAWGVIYGMSSAKSIKE